MHLTFTRCVRRLTAWCTRILHGHGFARCRRPLNLALYEVVINLGSVPLADYGLARHAALTEGMPALHPQV